MSVNIINQLAHPSSLLQPQLPLLPLLPLAPLLDAHTPVKTISSNTTSNKTGTNSTSRTEDTTIRTSPLGTRDTNGDGNYGRQQPQQLGSYCCCHIVQFNC